LRASDHRFVTETDTEVVAHLIEEYLKEGDSFEMAVRRSIHDLRGIFALSIISADEPDTIIAVRQGPPVVIGLGDGEYFVASDIPPILQHTRDVFSWATVKSPSSQRKPCASLISTAIP
jgi:glucosamine--fructose-6-phosphate aminotransferase (isomerizing)